MIVCFYSYEWIPRSFYVLDFFKLSRLFSLSVAWQCGWRVIFLVSESIFSSENSTPVATELAIRVWDALILPALLRTASCFARAHWPSLSLCSDLGLCNYLNSIVKCPRLYLGSFIEPNNWHFQIQLLKKKLHKRSEDKLVCIIKSFPLF